MTAQDRTAATVLDRLAFWWLRRTHPNGVTVMRSADEQVMLANYGKLAETERS